MITPDQAQLINEWIDVVHSLFPNIMILGPVCIILSYLPKRTSFGSCLEKVLVRIVFGMGILFTLYVISQGILGGCAIHLPQNWLAQEYLGRDEWWPFGLYGRQDWPWPQWTLRTFYLIISAYSTWRVWIYKQVRIPTSKPKLK